MDILGDLVGGQSCAADGTAAARNPISRIVDSLMEGSAGQQRKGRTRRAFNHGGAQGGVMVRPPQGVAPAEFAAPATPEAAEAQGVQQGSLALGPRGGAAPGGGQWMGPGLNASHQGAAFQQGHHAGDQWANDFGNHGPIPLPPPPPASVQQTISRDLQAAWGAGDGASAWADDFRRGGPERAMILPHPAAEMAWAAHDAMRGGVPMMGPHGRGHVHGVIPPLGHPSGEFFYPPFQRETDGTAHARDEDTAVSSSVGEVGFPAQGGGDAAPTGLESTVSSAASTGEGRGDTAEARSGSSSSITRVEDCSPGNTEVPRDVSDVRASARALAREMARDPDGIFRGSELFRLVGRLGEGELSIAGDKVIPTSGAGSMEQAWTEDAGAITARAGEGGREGLEGPWRWTAQGERKEAGGQHQAPMSTSFSDAWAGLDSGIGAREEPSALKPAVSSQQEDAWKEAEGAVDNEASAAMGDQDHQELMMQETMEAAWEAATAEAAAAKAAGDSANSIDPDLEAVWDVPEDGVDTLDGVWRRTAARLEAGETGLGGEEAPYELSADNRFSEHRDPFEEGVMLFEKGKIADAVLCFEAEIARNPENSQAWLMLGQSHAENDQDRLAISCLERAVEMDPYSLDALLALGTSYVNELDSQRALHNLKAWVQHNPKYAGLEITVDEYSDGTLMDEVMQLMIQAQRWDPTDADAHVVLGVLYNVSRDYDSAAEEFRRALEARPNDHSLWNKLGATLANHRRSEEALPAYRRAIAGKPGYARAWLNMGISQANLNRYEEASACYLQALRLNPEAKHIWSYLRIVLTCMERFDLVHKAAQEDTSLFEQDFDLALPTPPP